MTRALYWCALVALSGCNDPVRNQSLQELGGEAPGVPAGPLHRPGQPCLVCHGGEGPAESEFALAGTLYQRPTGKEPLHDARVQLIDSSGEQHDVVSDCAGNFWTSVENFRPAWPVWVTIDYNGQSVEMASAAFREGSCAGCHQATATPSKVGQVYFADGTTPFSQEACK